MLATHQALALVADGMPFRQAYRSVADAARGKDAAARPAGDYALPDYPGAPGNPDFEAISADRTKLAERVGAERRALKTAWDSLLR
jgi:argininosuccinate lyase